jgi:hypothetical protein
MVTSPIFGTDSEVEAFATTRSDLLLLTLTPLGLAAFDEWWMVAVEGRTWDLGPTTNRDGAVGRSLVVCIKAMASGRERDTQRLSKNTSGWPSFFFFFHFSFLK